MLLYEALLTLQHITNNQVRFLLAKLHSDSLQDAFTIDEIEETLESLSTGESAITDAYDSAIERIDMQRPKRKQLAHQVISWIVHSHRPLSPIEVQTALAIKPGHFKDPKRNLPGIKIVLAVCAGLVVVDEETRVIRLVHHTTQEYFSKGKLRGWLPGIEIEIAQSCLTYLLIPDLHASVLGHHEQWIREEYNGRRVPDDKIYLRPYYLLPSARTCASWEFWFDVERWPFFDYAIAHWGNHCRPFQKELEAMAMDFLSNPRAMALYWSHRMVWHDENLRNLPRYYLEQFQLGKPGPISVAARFGLDRYLEKLLRQGHIYEDLECISATEREVLFGRYLSADRHAVEQHPLVFASYWGSYQAATILLDHAYTAEQDLYRALRTAWYRHNTDIVELLISRWPFEEVDVMEIADYDVIDSEKSKEVFFCRNLKRRVASLKRFARRRNASSWIQHLLKADWEANVDESGFERKAALTAAVASGSLVNVRLLLAHPEFDLALERVNGVQAITLFEHALVSAAIDGRDEIVHFLLQNRPQLDPERMHPILKNAFAKILNRHSINFRSSGWERFRGLCFSEPSENNLLRCLDSLSSVALEGLNMQDRRSLVSEINERIRRELFDHPKIKSNQRHWKDNRTPISYAAEAAHNSVAVQLLLKHSEVDVDSRDRFGRTPLSHAASVTTNSATVRLFLDHPGVDPNSTDSNGWTPLSWAIFGGCVESVRTLLDHSNMSQIEYKRAATLRLAELWLGRKPKLSFAGSRLAEEDDDELLEPEIRADRAVLRLLRPEIDQLHLKEYSTAIINATLVLKLLEDPNE